MHAPHMLGNQLNPNSNMAQKMSDHLNSELEAHSIFSSSDNTQLIGPQLHHRVIAQVGIFKQMSFDCYLMKTFF